MKDDTSEKKSGNGRCEVPKEGTRKGNVGSLKSKARVSKLDDSDGKSSKNRSPERKPKPDIKESSNDTPKKQGSEGNRRRRVVLSLSPAIEQSFASHTEKRTHARQKGLLSDITHVLFSTNHPPNKNQTQDHAQGLSIGPAMTPQKHSSLERDYLEPQQAESHSPTEQQDSKQRLSQSTKQEAESLPTKRQPNTVNLSQEPTALSAGPSKSRHSPKEKRRADDFPQTTPKRTISLPEKKAIGRITREYQRRKNTLPHNRNTFSVGQRPSSATSEVTMDSGLLSRFITYNDQLLPAPAMPSKHYKPLSQYSPMSDRKRRRTKCSPALKERQETTSNDGVILCSLQNKLPALPLNTPESQSRKEFPNKSCLATSKPPSNRSYSRSNAHLLFDALRIIVIMCCTTSVTARCYVAFGGKFPPFHYMMNSPVLWLVKGYIIIFHLVLVIVEMDIGISCIIPEKTLDNFVHRGCLISFLGLLDLCMSTNKTLVDVAEELSEGVHSERGLWMRCAYLMLGVSSRGLAVAGLIYLCLGVIGYTGQSRRASKMTVRRVKTRRASI